MSDTKKQDVQSIDWLAISKQLPSGKTMAVVKGGVYQSDLGDGDVGYIDGYFNSEYGVHACFVRINDGLVDFVKPNQFTAKFASQRSG